MKTYTITTWQINRNCLVEVVAAGADIKYSVMP